ncbi:MAG: hypothetical protein QF441_12660 [Bacteriovoracaceae bacterium]|nr:hypothetical protein [Bacteriovoracaceae bacterium]
MKALLIIVLTNFLMISTQARTGDHVHGYELFLQMHETEQQEIKNQRVPNTETQEEEKDNLQSESNPRLQWEKQR